MKLESAQRRNASAAAVADRAPATQEQGSHARLRGRSLAEQDAMMSPDAQSHDAQAAALVPASPKGSVAGERAGAKAARLEGARAETRRAASGMLDDLAGWVDFAITALRYVKVDGMLDRAREVAGVIGAVKGGAAASGLGIDAGDHRLRNVAEMQSVIESQRAARGGEAPGLLAADGLRDANASFYVLLGNNAGRFDGLDMVRYRAIGALGVEEAAKVLPDFEAELFANQTDAATIAFGDSLSPAHRRQLFEAYNAGRRLVDGGAQVLDQLSDAGRRAKDWVKDLMSSR